MDDQQAREAAAKAYAENGPTPAEWDRMSPNMQERTRERVSLAIDAYLAALPVASRSDIPEQPTQAARARVSGFLDALDVLREEADANRYNDEVYRVNEAKLLRSDLAALVSSPSEQSAAPKETVTPVREAILREMIIREVIDWLEGYQPIAHAWDEAREHFGVSSG